MKALEVRKLTDEDLRRELQERQRELFNLRFQRATAKLENTARLRQVRGEIARLRTVVRERELLREEG